VIEPVEAGWRTMGMFGLDDWIAGLSDGASVVVVLLVATLLGLRHATDPDHIAAMTTLVASGRERVARSAARLGAWWGAGHAITLVVLGVPILLAERFLPERLQQGAETAVAGLVIYLGLRLIVRWRHGYFDLHAHPHPEQDHRHAVRTPLGAFGIGLVHGIGGSAGVGVLLLATIPSQTVALASLVLLAVFTGVAMTALTAGLGLTLSTRTAAAASHAAIPVIAVASLAFGAWYAAAAWSVAPYPF
jgi:ABC-type nickel/cobalt efflux system permease component RcnA